MPDLPKAANVGETIEAAVSNRAHALALDILHRIRPVCAHMPDSELLALSTQMAIVELSYFEQVAVPSTPRRRSATA